MRPLADSKDLALDFVRSQGAVIVEADPARLAQVLMNLLSNAIKFTPSGGRIAVVSEPLHDSVHVRVSDTGDGIDADFLPFVFDEFQQGSAARSAATGLGIGLTITKRLVDLHGGRIEAFSEGPNKGATFQVSLPLSRDRGE